MRENPSGSTRATVLDLAELPLERYRDSDNLVERLNRPNMCYAEHQKKWRCMLRP